MDISNSHRASRSNF